MKTIIRLSLSISVEVLLIFLVVLLYNNYIGRSSAHLTADGIGYYEYLPSLFIHQDFKRKSRPLESDPSSYERIQEIPGVYVGYEGFIVNKYPCGTALLQLPFFLGSYLNADIEHEVVTGYERTFQKSIYYATLFYLFLALFFTKKLLRLYEIQHHVIIVIQVLLTFSTGVLLYTYIDSGFSHVYSLFAISTFLFCLKRYFLKPGYRVFFIACVLLGIIILLRQINALILLFIPFIAGSYLNLKTGILHIFYKPMILILGLFIVAALVSLQCFMWYLQTGNFILYSYQGEGFNFLAPEIVNVLFSYRKGLFIYTPVLLLSVVAVVWLFFRKRLYEALTWVMFFALLTYVLSSWGNWYYGCSFGLRPFIDYYPVFFIPMAIFIAALNPYWKVAVILISLASIPLNIVQTYQYKYFILHWINMDKNKYWEIFMCTDDKYRGLVWKEPLDQNRYEQIATYELRDLTALPHTEITLLEESEGFTGADNTVAAIRVEIDDDFPEKSDALFSLEIKGKEANKTYYYHNRHYIQFKNKAFGQNQMGSFDFILGPIANSMEAKWVILRFRSDSMHYNFENVQVKYLKQKY